MFGNSEKKICATIEARMTSTRLPGKVMLDIAGKPVIQHIIERLRRSKYLDEIVVATTTNYEDDVLVKLCEEIGCKYYRGSENDVLLRVLQAAQSVSGDIIVEITGDCPFADWRHVDTLIAKFFSGDYDYVSNTIERTFPDGFDVQVFPTSVLNEVNTLTSCPVDHEHVSLFIYSNADRYKLLNWYAPSNLNYPDIEVTLDTKEDYKLISTIYEALYYKDQDFSADEVVEYLLQNPQLLKITETITRKNPYQEKAMRGTEYDR
ncbi:hypothetical protein BHU72_05225 [Desulfuribacillus stibiiarsenatis]|uniref:Spore coat biosynthesis protein F n=1 Tax=Desulfuribacillus stibiiarsenatis TaxID=1390249 RepID=A0A1E5L675_9FIRM|nr:glycosyltransferase family protein [Desulfuribacillus stibiiarsenatis]OEH85489.1 hypothetical protein BHU72_05225 [Desulfuribacillus stibiiarsenatis]